MPRQHLAKHQQADWNLHMLELHGQNYLHCNEAKYEKVPVHNEIHISVWPCKHSNFLNSNTIHLSGQLSQIEFVRPDLLNPAFQMPSLSVW